MLGWESLMTFYNFSVVSSRLTMVLSRAGSEGWPFGKGYC